MKSLTRLYATAATPRVKDLTKTVVAPTIRSKYKYTPSPRGSACSLTQGSIQTPADFLNTIKRGCEKHISKFPDWNSLFTTRSAALKEKGINVKERRWILRWVAHYRYVLCVNYKEWN